MAAPLILAAAMKAASGILDGVGQYMSSKQQITQNNLQAEHLLKQAYLNNIVAQKNIKNLQAAGMEQMSAVTDNYLNTDSDARVAAAVTGVDITKGSAKEVANASYLNYLKDKTALSKNIGTQVSEIETQANIDTINANYQAKALKIQNKHIKNTRWLGIGASLLGSGAQVASMFAGGGGK